MDFRQIGSSGLRASVAGLGCNNFGGRLDAAGSFAVIGRALERGVTLFDTADSYGKDGSSEILLGKGLGARRKDVLIATKFGWPLDDSGQRQGASRRYVFAAAEASLRRLGTDWIDLFQMHRPDPATPIAETLGALDELVAQGKVRAVGCSDLSVAQLEAADAAATAGGTARFVSCQHHYNLLTRGIETEIVPALERLGLSLIPYAPLAAGLLSGKYRPDAMPAGGRLTSSPKVAERYVNEANWARIAALDAFAAARGKSLLELAVAWVLSRRVVCSVIAGAMSPEQVDANVAATGWVLNGSDLVEIDRITRGA